MSPEVSIVIPAYKPTFFAEALTSACLQANAISCEILVGDDSEGSEIQRLSEAIQKKFSVPIRYYKNVPRAGEALNLQGLIHAASAEIIKPLHDDDVLAPGAALEMASALRQFPDVAFVTTNRLKINEASLVIEAPYELAYCKIAEDRVFVSGFSTLSVLATKAINFIGEPSCVCFRKDQFTELGDSFNRINAKHFRGLCDLAMWVNLIGPTFRDFIYLPQTLAFHRLHTATLTGKIKSLGLNSAAGFSEEILRYFGVNRFPIDRKLLDRLEMTTLP